MRLVHQDMTEDIRAAVAAERRDQAALLSGLTEEQWNAPSLCEGWTVKHVVAHTTLPFRSSGKRVILEILKSAWPLQPRVRPHGPQGRRSVHER